MSLNDILTGIDEIRAELEKMTTCLIRLGERVARMEAAQQGHNGTAPSVNGVTHQGDRVTRVEAAQQSQNGTAPSGNGVAYQGTIWPGQGIIEPGFLNPALTEGERYFVEEFARRRAHEVPVELPGEPVTRPGELHGTSATTVTLASPSDAPADALASRLRESRRPISF
jgi:hypothetical protein